MDVYAGNLNGFVWTLVALLLMTAMALPIGRLVSILRREHPDLYVELGRPRFLWGGDAGATWKFARFLFSERPRLVSDSRVNRLCLVTKILYVPTMIWIALPFLLILWFAVFPQSNS